MLAASVSQQPDMTFTKEAAQEMQVSQLQRRQVVLLQQQHWDEHRLSHEAATLHKSLTSLSTALPLPLMQRLADCQSASTEI